MVLRNPMNIKCELYVNLTGPMLIILLLIVSTASFADEFVVPGPPRALVGGFMQSEEILPVDEAFRLGSVTRTQGVSVFWQVMPGYFLYQDKIRFELEGQALAVDLREGAFREDETFGRVRVLDGLVEVELPEVTGSVSVYYQGCAAQGFCYPPQVKAINPEKNAINPEKL